MNGEFYIYHLPFITYYFVKIIVMYDYCCVKILYLRLITYPLLFLSHYSVP
jgi:hypothetical protein